MIVDCIGCLHGSRPKLEGGDLLIVTGDLTARDGLIEHSDFLVWLDKQDYRKKVIIAGNHDNFLESNPKFYAKTKISYLCDRGIEFEEYKIWGSPWTAQFEGMNPHCKAFTIPLGTETEEQLAEKWKLIPSDVDILITHSPPFAILDETTEGKQVGSLSLMAEHLTRFRPKLWVWSHIHEAYGQTGPYHWNRTKYVNCSIMNERYEPVNAPIRIILGDEDLPGCD